MPESPRVQARQHLILLVNDVLSNMKNVQSAISSLPEMVIDLVGSIQAAQERMTLSRVDVVFLPWSDRSETLGFINRIRFSNAQSFVIIIVILRTWQRPFVSKALHSGVDAVLIDESHQEIIQATMLSALQRVDRWRRHQQRRSPSLAGDDTSFALPDLISFLSSARKTGLLEVITHDGHQADLIMRNGSLDRAVYRNQSGEQAVIDLLADYPKSRFSFHPDRDASAEIKLTCRITRSVSGLLLEAAKEADDAMREAVIRKPIYRRERTEIISGCAPAKPIISTMVEIAVQALRDDANLAECVYIDATSLVSDNNYSDWLRCMAVVDEATMPLLLQIASPVSPEQMGKVLVAAPIAIRLILHGINNGFELLLVQHERMKDLMQHLIDGPHFVILFPDLGDWENFPIASQRSIIASMATLSPHSVYLSGLEGASDEAEASFAKVSVNQKIKPLPSTTDSDIRALLISACQTSQVSPSC